MNEQELKEQLKREIRQEMKKSARKKRIIILVIILVIIAGIFIYVKISNDRLAELNKQYTYEEISQYKKEIPITTENWKEYITTEDTTAENKDNFGNVTSKYEKTQLKLKDNICGYVVLELNIPKNKYNKKQNIVIIGGTNNYYENSLIIYGEQTKEGDITIYHERFTLDDLEVVQIKGYIYTIDIPEEMWRTRKNSGEKYINYENITLYKDNTNENRNYIYTLSYKEYEKYKEQIGK